MTTLDQAFSAWAEPVFAQRAARFRGINTATQVATLQTELRALARDSFGAYSCGLDNSSAPPKVLKSGEVKLDGIVIEKFLYEAFPDFWVSAVIYRPVRPPHSLIARPAMVMPVGHWWEGKSAPMYQRLMRLMARRGILCASFDDCGQGERVEHFQPVVRDNMQYLMDIHPPGQPIGYPLSEAPRHGFLLSNNVTCEHCLIGDPGYLCGVHQNTLTTIAGKRLVDLLVSREDVDSKKIGAMGASGGGTNTRFLLAYDPRIALAVPTSILGADRSISGGDADQCLFFTVNRGFSQIDLLITHAPKPLLIVSASEDHHRSDLVAEFYRPFWKAFGKEGNVEFGTGEGPHGFPLPSRKIIAEFVLKHFLGDTRPVLDAEHADTEPLFSEAALRTTLLGNLSFEGIGKRAVDLIRERAVALQKSRPTLSGGALVEAVKKTLLEPAEAYTRPAARLESSAAEIRWETEGGVPLRITFPQKPGKLPGAPTRVLLYAHDKGPNCPGQALLEPLVAGLPGPSAGDGGVKVGVLELRGTGVSLRPGPENNNAMLAPMLFSKQGSLTRTGYTLGRSLIGMRVVDLLQAARVLRATVPANVPIDLIVEGGLGFAAALAALIDPAAFNKVTLYRAPLSWTEFCVNEARAYPFSDYLFGVLEHFDLPDVTKALPAGKLTWINPTDAGMRVVPLAQAKRTHKGAAIDFRHARVAGELLRLLKK